MQRPDKHSSQYATFEATRRRMMGLFARARITDDLRHDLVYNFTAGRTSSSTGLELSEMRELCMKLQNELSSSTQVDLYLEMQRKKLRSQVLKIATDCGIKDPAGFDSFNRFMLTHSILKKELHKYNLEELHSLVKQFRGLSRNYEASANKPGTKAWHQATGIPELVTN